MDVPVATPWRVTMRWRFNTALAALVRERLGVATSFDFAVLFVLCVGSFVLALAHPWSHAYVGDAQYGDAAYWDFAGENWARGYVGAKAPDIRPGYSVFLGIVYSLFGARFQNAFIAQSLLYAIGVGMVFSIGKRIGGRLTGLLAALMLALDPYMWEWNATSTTELLGSIANLAAVFFLIRALSSRRALIDVALFGACLAIANIVRPVTLPFLAPALLVLLVKSRGALVTRVGLATIAVSATAVALVPSIAYQYAATGDPGLSSNSAANLYAASDPAYGTWTPAIYDAVAAGLSARGVVVTTESMNAEFTRLTIQNYLQHPGYQVARVVDAFRQYGAFEGETERPEQYTFFRPYVALAAVALAIVLVLTRLVRTRVWVLAPALLVAAVLVVLPAPALVVAAILGLIFGVRAVIARNPRVTSLAVVGLYWLTTGLMAILTTGIAGFFLNRLYTQVEPERVILIAAGVLGLALLPIRTRQRARALSLRELAEFVPRLPRIVQSVPALAGALSIVVALLGTGSLVAANVVPVKASEAYIPPTPTDLQTLAATLELPAPPQYVDASSYAQVYASLVSGKLPSAPTVYAIPGQFTRFLWYLADQDRTLYWYVFSDRARPASLDLARITAESVGQLTDTNYGNRDGLLIAVTDSAYFDATGDVTLQNVVTARAFVPWDDVAHRFRVDSPTVFPLAIPLYDHARFGAADRAGNVSEAGPLRVRSDGRLLRALSFVPSRVVAAGERDAAITYRDIWIPTGAHLKGWIALHPRLFGNSSVGIERVQIGVATATGTVQLAEYELDPLDTEQRSYAPVDVDLTALAGDTVGLQLRVLSSTTSADGGEVLVAEPRLVVSQ